ncbi:MAG: T9SS C-terminal target domain-containing protein [Bacteroidetes bacterium]|nr:MAG: T9SS C-terminal target domain-containing protein [Bacteroidota bacterium]
MNKKYYKMTKHVFLLLLTGVMLLTSGFSLRAQVTILGTGASVQDFGVNTITVPNFNVAPGNDKLLVAFIDWVADPTGASLITEVSFDGQLFSHAVTTSQDFGGGVFVYSSIWYLPLGSGCTTVSGSNDVVIKLNDVTNGIFASATVLANVDQTNPLGSTNSSTGQGVMSSSVTVASVPGDMVVDAIMALNTIKPGAGQTALLAVSGTGGAASYKAATTNSTTMDWTVDPPMGSPNFIPAVAHVAANFKQCSSCTAFPGVPLAMASGGAIDCFNPMGVLDGTGSTTGNNITYEWTKISGTGNLTGPTNAITATTDGPGVFRLTVRDVMFGCEAFADATVVSNIDHVTSNDDGEYSFEFDQDTTATLKDFIPAPGCDRLMVVSVNWISNPTDNGADQVLDIQYNGQSLTEIATTSETYTFTKIYSSLWYLPLGSGCSNPDTTGTNGDILVTLNNGTTAIVYVGATTFENVDQAAPIGNFMTNKGSSAMPSISLAAGSNNMVVASIMAGSFITPDPSQTPVYITNPGSGSSMCYEAGNGGMVSIDWTQMSSLPFAQVAAELVNCTACQGFPTPPTAMATASTITCNNATATLDGTGSSTGANISYAWTKVSGTGNLVGATDGITATADGTGVFRLTVTNNMTFCSNSVDVTVNEDFTTPVVMANASVISCAMPTATLDGTGSTTTNTTFNWTKLSGIGEFVGPTNNIMATVDGPGQFLLTVTDTINGCSDSKDVFVTEDGSVPVATAVATDIDCMNSMATLDGSASASGPNIVYSWTKISGAGNLVGPVNNNTATADGTGVFRLTVTDTVAGCSGRFDIEVFSNLEQVVSDNNGIYIFDADEDVTVTLPGLMVPDGCDRMLVVSATWVSVPTAGGADAITGITFNGQPLTEAVTKGQTFLSTNLYSSLWYLPLGSGCAVDPATFNTDIVVNFNNTSTSIVFVGASTFQHVNQSTPVANIATNTGSGTSASLLIPGATGNMIVDAMMSGAFITPDPTQIPVYTTMPGSGSGSSYEIGNGGMVAMDWTLSASSPFTQVALELANTANPAFFPAAPNASATASVITCANPTATLDGTGSSTGANISYAWTKVSGTGNLVGATDGITATADGTGVFRLTVIDNSTFCSASTDVTVTEDLAAPTANASATLITCANPVSTLNGNGSTATNVTYEWTKISGTGNLTGPTNGITAMADGPGVFRLTVTNTGNGCTASADVTVNQDSAVPNSVATATVITCANPVSTLNGAGSSTGANITYEWTKISGTGNLTGSTNTLATTADGTGVFRLTVTNTDNGCTSVADVTVMEDTTPPTVVATATDITCLSNLATLDGTGSSTTNANYSWTKVSGAGDIVGPSNAITATVNGTGIFTLTITNTVNGCTNSANVEVIEIPDPVASIVSQTDVSCYGDSTGMAKASVINGQAPFQYTWSNGADSASVFGLPAGTFTVTVTDANGCTDTESVTISQPDSIHLTISSTLITTVGGNDGTASVTASGGTPPYQFLWSNASTTQQIDNLTSGYYQVTVTDNNQCQDTIGVLVLEKLQVMIMPDTVPFCEGSNLQLTAMTNRPVSYDWNTGSTAMTAIANSTGTYVVTVTDNFGMTATASLFIETLPLPDVTITADGPNQFCEGGSVTLTASGGVSYVWDDPNNTTGPTLVATQTNGYTVTVTDANGCTNSETFSVTAYPLPNVTLSAPNGFDFCEGETITVTASADTIVDLFWSTLDTNVMMVTLDQTTNLQVVVVDGHGCVDSASVVVTERPLPTATIAPDTLIEFCSNTLDSIDLTASGGATYQWSTGENTATIKAFGAGQYAVTVTDNFGCSDTESASIVVHDAPVAQITALGATTFCEGESVQLEASGGIAYAWSTGDTTTAIVADATGTYAVTVTNANGCTDVATMDVQAIPFPDITLTPNDPTGCAGDTIVLNVATDPTNMIMWSTGETTSSIQTTVSGNYSVVVTDPNGCSSNASTNVTIHPLPVVSVTPSDTLIQAGQNVTLIASGGVQFLWSDGSTNAILGVNTAGTYSVTVTDANGCTGTASANVEVANLPTVSIEIDGNDAFCEGDSVVLNALATGVPPLTYLWSTNETTPGITVHNSGTYSVTITDVFGFTATASQSITVYPTPAAPIILPNGNQTICQGETLTLLSNLPNGNIWLPGEIPGQTLEVTTAGVYTAYWVDPNGCRSPNADSVFVEVAPIPAAPVISVEPDTVVCAPQTITLSSNYATGNMWSNNATTQMVNVTAGTQTFTVTHTDANGCTSEPSEPVTVSVLLQPNGSITVVGDTILCQDESVELIANGGVEYFWNVPGPPSQSITVSSSGLYAVTVVGSNGCQDVVTQNIVVNPLPVPTITVVGDTLYASAAVSYQWYFNGAILPGETNQWIVPTQAGEYSVEVTDDNGCSGISFPLTGTTQLENTATISVYPVPAQSRLFVDLTLKKQIGEVRIRLVNLFGQLVYDDSIRPNTDQVAYQIDLDNLPAGTYYLHLEMEGQSVIEKVIKQ